jgi:hypothetical protein
MHYSKIALAKKAIDSLRDDDLFQAGYYCKQAQSSGFDEAELNTAPEVSASQLATLAETLYLKQQGEDCLRNYKFSAASRYIEAMRLQIVASAPAKKA